MGFYPHLSVNKELKTCGFFVEIRDYLFFLKRLDEKKEDIQGYSQWLDR